MKRKLLTLILIAFISFLVSGCKTNEEKPLTDDEVNEKLSSLKDYGLDLFQKADHLPLLRRNTYSEQTSSYSRNGNNVDGFGMGGNVDGEVSSLAIKRPLLILNQPGVVYRMWFTSWADTPSLRIYIDNDTEITYRFNLYEMVSGQTNPFVKELVFNRDESSGGYVSYVPIVFKEKIEIYGSGDFYYNINFQKYPIGTNLDYDDFESGLDKAVDILSNPSVDPKITNNDILVSNKFNLDNNQTITLYETDAKQTITSLKVKFPNFTVREFDRTIHNDTGYSLSRDSEIEFDITVKSAGQHQLKFRGILGENEDQNARVSMDGIYQEELKFRRRRYDGFEWKDDPFFLDSIVTLNVPEAGKYRITIKGSSTAIGIFNVSLFENGKRTDFLDFGVESEEKKHNFKILEGPLVSRAQASLEYDPNSLIDQVTWSEIYHEEDLVNQIYLKITYPDLEEPAVYAPISSFFGYGEFGLFKTLGIMVGLSEDGWMYSYYPMPFEKGIKIELINESGIGYKDLESQISYETNSFASGTYGYFKANYVKNEFDTPSALQNGKPIEFLNVDGAGHVVGITHSQTGAYFGLHSRFYLEGDEQIYLDGSMSHAFHGTGTEDLYNGGWYFKNGVQNRPLFGQSNHNYRDDRDRTVMVRTFLTDPIYFKNGIDFKLEHGGNNDRADSDVYVITYYYHQERALMVKTDELSLSKIDEIASHNYITDPTSTFDDISIHGYTYEGQFIHKRTTHNTMAKINKSSEFEVSIFDDNDGVILRREYLLEHINQSANIYVDDQLVGVWQSPHRNAFGFFVRQDDFHILSQFTSGKSKIKIKIEVIPNDELESIWTESYYEVYSIVK